MCVLNVKSFRVTEALQLVHRTYAVVKNKIKCVWLTLV